jgi:NADH-quinone oxidoreductase subunit J
MEFVIFVIGAVLALAGAFGVVLGRNPVHCALFLLMTMCSMALFFLMLNADLVAIIQIVVYASAIVVLFLFVITLLGVDRHEQLDEPMPFQRYAAITLGVLFLAGVVFVTTRETWVTGRQSALAPLAGPETERGGNVRDLASVLFTHYLWAFEITAVLLVIAVVGGVVLARRSGQRVIDMEPQS